MLKSIGWIFVLFLTLTVKAEKANLIQMKNRVDCDILIVGGGLGGCSAALHAAKMGMKVCLIEECSWIGGQITSQGVSALDEHDYIEQFGGTATYYQLRNGIRDYYRQHYQLSDSAKNNQEFDPGNCWVSRLAFEPKVGLLVLQKMQQPYLDDGMLAIYTNTKPIGAAVKHDQIINVTAINILNHDQIIFDAKYFIDASELGDLLPLTGAEYVVGAEPFSLTQEPHAHAGDGYPESVQSFTYTFVVEYCQGGNHTIPKPDNYEFNRDHQPYSFITEKGIQYRMFGRAPGTPGSFWAYRRLIDASQFKDNAFSNDIAMINWHSNDFRGGSIIDVSPQQRQQRLQQAKNLSLGFLYWLQTEVPRDDGGSGYPELKLRKDIMGTDDVLSQFPYIRESRRIKAMQTIREQDISAEFQTDARAKFFDNSIGIGKYWIDLHCCSDEDQGLFLETKPFQIPLGVLIPLRMKNLIAGSKNIGTTNITNGAYRLHPIEWAIGEAAGALAVMAIKEKMSPHQIHASSLLVWRLQYHLVQAGVPIFWFVDVPPGHPASAAVQWLAAMNIIEPDSNTLCFTPDEFIATTETRNWNKNSLSLLRSRLEREKAFLDTFSDKVVGIDELKLTRAQFAQALASTIEMIFLKK